LVPELSAYEIVTFRGHRFDRMTVQALLEMERRLGYELSVAQGSYNHGVGASAGTHDGGGAVDLQPADAARKVRVGREIGFAMWERHAIPGVWPHHVHGILIGNAKVSPGAAQQVYYYRLHRNGLRGEAWDSTWHPSPIRPYVYKAGPVSPAITRTLDLSNVRIDFFSARDGHITNTSHHRSKVIQRLLNKRNRAGLLVDGVVGEKTLAAWKNWERHNGDPTPNSIPDWAQLTALLKGSTYRLVP
jgi:hypothetical protein